MEIVLAHNNADFDSIAAQYAVTKLYPAVRMVPGYPLPANIRSFMSLYRDSLPIADLQYTEVDKIKHVFLVDCQHAERLDDVARNLIETGKCTFTVFDHHHLDPDGLGPRARQDSIIRPVGAATTVVVDELRRRNVKLSPFEATLFCIGIYEDTGCLTYAGTSETDALCVAYVLAHGADLNQVNNFINPKLTEKQMKLFQSLIRNAHTFPLSGAKVLVAHGKHDDYLEGLATITRRLLEVTDADAAVSIVYMRDRTHIVCRSDSPAINMRDVAVHFGGDGHPGASSAVSKDLSIEEIRKQVEEVLRSRDKPEVKAAEIMTCPVSTIRPDTSMEEAGRIMLRYGQDGLIISEGNEIIGVVSRRDVDKATHHKLGHAPVRGFMSRPVITIDGQTTLGEIQRTMISEDIGRLPVVDNAGNLLGIVTRKDVLRTLYGTVAEQTESWRDTLEKKVMDLNRKLNELDSATNWLFKIIGKTASERGMRAHAVGGCVRDLILGKPNFDLDFVIEGSAIDLAQELETRYPSRFEFRNRHDRFQTATYRFHAAERRDIDFSTARTEFYESPAALPTVEPSGLEQDLFRRDFTINALALCLNPDKYGEVIDYCNGITDIDNKIIRVLHDFSFIEDPTRIIRAVRFATRLNFKLDEKTKELAERAIAMGIFEDLGGYRLKEELKPILESDRRIVGLEMLAQLGGGLRYLSAPLRYDTNVRRLLRRAERLLKRFPLDDAWIIYLALLLSPLDKDDLEAAMERLYLSNEEKQWIREGIKLPSRFRISGERLPSSRVYAELHGHPDHVLAIAACLGEVGSQMRRAISEYLSRLRDVSVTISGGDLIKMGFPQGPEIKEALSRLHEAKLDRSVRTSAEEIEFLRREYPQYAGSENLQSQK